MRNLAELLRHRVLQTPDRDAIRHLDHTLTWRELYQYAFFFKEKLKERGIRRGDVVGIYSHHSLGQVVAIFATVMNDAIFTFINPLLKEDQIKHQIQDSDIKFMIGSKEMLCDYQSFFNDRNITSLEILPNGMDPEKDVLASPHPDPLVSVTLNVPTDISNIIYTSGSTGKPKGVVIPHRTLCDGARIVSGYLKITPEDKILSILPYGFDYGLNQLLGAVHVGAKIVIHKHVMPTDLLKILAKEKITGMAVVPSIWPSLLQYKKNFTDSLESLRYITTAGGFHPIELLKSIVLDFPKTEIIVMYGLTESFRSTYLPFKEIFNRPGSIGRAVPEVEILVVNERGEPVKVGEKGELIHRGAFVSYGYLNNPELTEQKFIKLNTAGPGCLPEMAVRSGDIVALDQEGYIYYHGRADLQIKSNGYRISPDEISEVLLSIPDVKLACVFGLPDADLGQSVNAAYETYSGQPIDRMIFVRGLNKQLPSYAVPKNFKFYERLPLNLNGKVDLGTIKNQTIEELKQP